MRVSFQDQLDRTETALQEEGEFVLRALRGAMNALWEQDTELFADMGARAEGMIRVALDAFEARDVEAAESLVELDELIDRANRRIVGQVLALGSDPERLEWGLRMITVSRCLERIGDHAVDIGEQIAYLVTGEFREFTDASRRPDSPRA
jgi:phosphate transport system protein